MTHLKFLLPFIIGSIVSSEVNAAYYQESIRLFDEYYSSPTPSADVVSMEKTVENYPSSLDYGASYSVIKAELNASPMPYVSTSNTAYASTGETNRYTFNRGFSYLNIVSGINYGFTINGAPNSVIPVSMLSIARFNGSDNIQTRSLEGVNYSNGTDRFTGSSAGLTVDIADYSVSENPTGRSNFYFEGGRSWG